MVPWSYCKILCNLLDILWINQKVDSSDLQWEAFQEMYNRWITTALINGKQVIEHIDILNMQKILDSEGIWKVFLIVNTFPFFPQSTCYIPTKCLMLHWFLKIQAKLPTLTVGVLLKQEFQDETLRLCSLLVWPFLRYGIRCSWPDEWWSGFLEAMHLLWEEVVLLTTFTDANTFYAAVTIYYFIVLLPFMVWLLDKVTGSWEILIWQA